MATIINVKLALTIYIYMVQVVYQTAPKNSIKKMDYKKVKIFALLVINHVLVVQMIK